MAFVVKHALIIPVRKFTSVNTIHTMHSNDKLLKVMNKQNVSNTSYHTTYIRNVYSKSYWSLSAIACRVRFVCRTESEKLEIIEVGVDPIQ